MERVISRAHSLVQKLVTPAASEKATRDCLLDLSRDLFHSCGPLRLAFSTRIAETDSEVEIRRPSRRTREAELRERTQREALLNLVTDAMRSSHSAAGLTQSSSAPLSESQALVAFFSKPLAREYVFRAVVPPLETRALPAPQRLHALITRDSVHISGAFSRETLAF